MTKKSADKDTNQLEKKLEEIAIQMADQIMTEEPPTKAQVETFKILANFYVGSRSKGLAPNDGEDENEGGFSFRDTKARLLKGSGK